MIGLSAAVYCCFQLSSCLAAPIFLGYRHLSLSARRKITVNVFIQRLQTFSFLFLSGFFTFLTFFIFGERFFIYAMQSSVQKRLNRSRCRLRFGRE